MSELERRLKDGQFVVTAEVAPPMSTATGQMTRNIQLVKPYVAAINFTDNPSATARMSSLACSVMAMQNGAEPVMQIAAREKTRTSLQSEVIGASALGIRNVLCLSGDSGRMGPAPMGRLDVLDLDSVQMLWILRRMRDEGALPGWPRDQVPAESLHRRGGGSVCLAARIPGDPRAQEGQRRGAVLPDESGV